MKRLPKALYLRLGMCNIMSFFHIKSRSAAGLSAGLVHAGRRPRPRLIVAAGLLAFACGWTAKPAFAQSTSLPRYFPLDQTIAPGVAGRWAGIRPGFVPALQPVRVELGEQGGQVSFYTGPDAASTTVAAPATAGLLVGPVYRLKISDLKDFPGVELYPTVELVDRLHPPRGREVEFAVPITLTAEEISSALDGRLITKVIYLEQPDRAAPVGNATAARTQLARPRDNALALADEAGRPMVIVRLGGRLPDAAAFDTGFYGTGAPVRFFAPQAATKEAARR